MSTFPNQPPNDDELANQLDEDMALEELSDEFDRDLTSAESRFDSAIDMLTKERDEYREQHLRAMADLQNARKRFAQERQEIHKYATEKLVAELVPVLDGFERTMNAIGAGASSDSIVEGISLVERQLRTVLQSVRLERIEALGKPFDPELHEAISSVESTEFPEGTVVEELQPGYKLADRVIRPTRVRVAKKP